jgi:hypothetical protein
MYSSVPSETIVLESVPRNGEETERPVAKRLRAGLLGVLVGGYGYLRPIVVVPDATSKGAIASDSMISR